MKRLLAITILAGLLTGCASYRPIPTEAEHKGFRTYVLEEMKADNKATFEIVHTSRALSRYSEVIMATLRERAGRSWDTSDAATVGAGGAVLGGLAGKIGLLNTGMFVAGTAITASTRYKQDQQVDLSLATANRLSCLHGRVGMLTPELLRLARTSGDQGAIDAMASAPEDIIRNVEVVQHSHLTSFYALKATVPSKAELLDVYGRYSNAQAAAGAAAAKAAKTPETEAAVKVVRTLAVELEACAKLAS